MSQSGLDRLFIRRGAVELITKHGDRVQSAQDLARLISDRAGLSSAEYRFLGAVAVIMAAVENGSLLDASALLKLRDMNHVSLPDTDAARAFAQGEDEAATRLANVDPGDSLVHKYVEELNKAIAPDGRTSGRRDEPD